MKLHRTCHYFIKWIFWNDYLVSILVEAMTKICTNIHTNRTRDMETVYGVIKARIGATLHLEKHVSPNLISDNYSDRWENIRSDDFQQIHHQDYPHSRLAPE